MIELRGVFFALALCLNCPALASPEVNVEKLGESMGGWKDKGGKAAKFEVSGSRYRCWKPELSSTPEGGIFISLRIDHLRGVFASDDHSSLEVTFDKKGDIVTARSSIALQGKKVTSDLIEGTGKLGARLVGMELAARVGTEMISNLSAKILRENIREPGRVSFPAVMQHQYNLLCAAVITPDQADASVALEDGGLKAKPEQRKAVPLKITPIDK